MDGAGRARKAAASSGAPPPVTQPRPGAAAPAPGARAVGRRPYHRVLAAHTQRLSISGRCLRPRQPRRPRQALRHGSAGARARRPGRRRASSSSSSSSAPSGGALRLGRRGRLRLGLLGRLGLRRGRRRRRPGRPRRLGRAGLGAPGRRGRGGGRRRPLVLLLLRGAGARLGRAAERRQGSLPGCGCGVGEQSASERGDRAQPHARPTQSLAWRAACACRRKRSTAGRVCCMGRPPRRPSRRTAGTPCSSSCARPARRRAHPVSGLAGGTGRRGAQHHTAHPMHPQALTAEGALPCTSTARSGAWGQQPGVPPPGTLAGSPDDTWQLRGRSPAAPPLLAARTHGGASRSYLIAFAAADRGLGLARAGGCVAGAGAVAAPPPADGAPAKAPLPGRALAAVARVERVERPHLRLG